MPADLAPFDVTVDHLGIVDQRSSAASITAELTPSGIFGDYSALFRCWTQRPGEFLVPVHAVVAIDTGARTWEITKHSLLTGDTVYCGGAGTYTLPSGVNATTLYYVRKMDANNVALYPTLADAVADTNVVYPVTEGVGILALIQEQPLVVTTNRRTKITFYNACVVQPPPILPSAVKTIYGSTRFEVFRRHGKAWGDEESLFKIESATWTDAEFDAADIITQPYSAAWGAVAPWADINTESGFNVETELRTTEKGSDAVGTMNRMIDLVYPTARFTPIGIMEADILGKLRVQGSGNYRGQSFASGSNDLIITGSGVYISLTGAQLRTGPTRYNRHDYRSGELHFVPTLSFTGGLPNPLGFVGTAAPGS